MYRYFSLMLLAVMVTGCATTGTATDQGSSSSQGSSSGKTPAEISSQQGVIARADAQKKVQPSLSNKKSSKSTLHSEIVAHRKFVDELNEKIVLSPPSTFTREDYKVGPGDVIEIAVFQVGALNKKVRVSGDGYILLPLLGAIKIAGKTTAEIQKELTERLAKNYLQDPQVTIFVSEYRSHQVAVLGAVSRPNIYHTQWPRTVLEMLSKAGGLSGEAGTRLRVQRNVTDEQSGQQTIESHVIDMQTLLSGENLELNFLLSAGDSIMVPKAGSIFIEGSVARSGAYPIRGKTNVLKALALAGGVSSHALKNAIQVFRQSPDGTSTVYELSLQEIRRDPSNDLVLEDGDIIVVRNDSVKTGLTRIWRGFTSIFSVSVSRTRKF